MENVRQLYLRSWRGLALAVSLALIAYLLYFQRLGSLLPGYSKPELGALTAAGNWRIIAHDPINAPYKAFVWLFTALMHHGILTTRAVAAGYGLAAGLLFFIIVRAWCTYRAAYLATVMFVTSAGLLHFARLGTGDILQMGMLTLLSLALWYRRARTHRLIIGYLIAVVFVLLWYIPGMIWFEALGVLALSSTIRHQLGRTKTLGLVGLLPVLLVCVAPLAVAAVRHPKLLLQVVGLPSNVSAITHFGGNLWNAILAIVVHSNGRPLLWAGHAPLLDSIEVIVGLLGAYYLGREASGRRTFLVGSVAIGLILTALGVTTFACLVPILYLFIALGIDHLLGQWLSVFPRNPVARLTGVSIVCIMLTFSVLYQLRNYYVAWPHVPAVHQTFSHRAP